MIYILQFLFILNNVATFSLFKQTLSKKNPTAATATATNALGNKAKREKFVLVDTLNSKLLFSLFLTFVVFKI